MKVWVVTEGSYSDYRIVGIYDSRALAELHCKRLYDANDPEEWEVNAGAVGLRAELSHWAVYITDDGTIISADDWHDPFIQIDAEGMEDIPALHGQAHGLRVHVLARDEAHARKIATDKRAEWLAKQEGVT